MDYKTYILDALRSCADNLLEEPRIGLRKDHFAYLSYQRWAVEEVIKYVENYNGEPEDGIESFIEKVNEYSCRKHNGMIFSVAYDAAVWLLDVLISMENL